MGDVEQGAGAAAEVLSHRGARVDFHVASYSVRLKGGERKTILNDVRGVARSGEVLSIMGPSGAGKSTLVRPCLYRHLRTGPSCGQLRPTSPTGSPHAGWRPIGSAGLQGIYECVCSMHTPCIHSR